MNVSERIQTVISKPEGKRKGDVKVTQDRALKVGDKVRNVYSGEFGTIAYSTFGLKVKGRDKDGGRWKTNGYHPKYIARYWEVVDE